MKARAVAMALWVGAFAASGCGTRIDSQRLPIGGPCNSSGQCGTGKFFCDTSHPNGYCKADCKSDADCPQGSICVSAACEKTCATVDECRAGDLCMAGYCDQPPIIDMAATD